MNLNFSFNECVNKTVFIKLIEDEDINTEIFEIKDINDYFYLRNYIKELNNKGILDEYFIYE